MRQIIPVIAALGLAAGAVPAWSQDDSLSRLFGRSVDYDHASDSPVAQHRIQTWKDSGETMVTNVGVASPQDYFGQWKVENGLYCESFGGAPNWSCFQVTFSDDGMFAQFTAAEGVVSLSDDPIFADDRKGRFLAD